MVPNTAESTIPTVKPVFRTVFDLDRKEDVTLTKTPEVVAPVMGVSDFMVRVGNDDQILIDALTSYLQSQENKKLVPSNDGSWREKESGDAYKGSPAHPDVLGPILRPLYPVAQQMLGVAGQYKSLEKDVKSKVFNAALSIVLSNAEAVESLKKLSADEFAKE